MGTKGNQGIRTKNLVHPSVRTGKGSRSTNPGYVSQLGNKVGSHVTNKGDSGYRGEIFHDQRNFNPTKFGNEIALNSKSGPGQGRTVYHCGYQGQHGATNPGSPRPNTQCDALEQE
jgi:hypothetical protein